jgi:putative resolvase
MKYYSIHDMSKILGVTPQTLRNWDAKGKLRPDHTRDNGYRYYSQKQLNDFLGIQDNGRKVVGYCRVSSNKQKDDLARQVASMDEYLKSLGAKYEIIQDVGSGINYTKKGLRQLLKSINRKEVSKVVVFYKDRLLRFGFELIEYVANINGCEIEVLDSTEKSEQEELVEDLVQIITVFSCKLQGKRANKTCKLVEELTKEDGNSSD